MILCFSYEDFLFLYFPIRLCPHTCRASPIIDIPDQGGPSVRTDGAPLTHNCHRHPKSIIYTVVSSRCWTNIQWQVSIIAVLCRVFSLPQISSMLCLFTPPILNLKTTDLVVTATVSSFPECQCGDHAGWSLFSRWRHSLSNVLSQSSTLSWLDSSFLLSTE